MRSLSLERSDWGDDVVRRDFVQFGLRIVCPARFRTASALPGCCRMQHDNALHQHDHNEHNVNLDNFDHVTAYWVGMGMKMAQVALSYGADDLHGTIVEEHIFHMAGAKSPQMTAEKELVKAIREAGREPVQRNTFYEPIRRAA